MNTVADALRLDREAFERIGGDGRFTAVAAGIVILASLLSGVAVFLEDYPLRFEMGRADGSVAMAALFQALQVLLGFLSVTVGVWMAGNGLSSSRRTYPAVVRVVGVAYLPMLLGLFRFVPIAGWLVAAVGVAWSIVAIVIGTQAIYRISTVRAAMFVFAGAVLSGVVVLLAGFLFP
jgi:hypothetical protein